MFIYRLNTTSIQWKPEQKQLKTLQSMTLITLFDSYSAADKQSNWMLFFSILTFNPNYNPHNCCRGKFLQQYKMAIII